MSLVYLAGQTIMMQMEILWFIAFQAFLAELVTIMQMAHLRITALGEMDHYDTMGIIPVTAYPALLAELRIMTRRVNSLVTVRSISLPETHFTA